MTSEASPNWKRGDPVGYIRPECPPFGFPAFAGQRYEALVPDTLDLQERAALAVNGLTGPTDPDADCEHYFYVNFHHNPPVMQHSYGDQCQTKFQESLPLMRIISGSDLNLDVERRLMAAGLRHIGPDGLTYGPLEGRPWGLILGSIFNVHPDQKQFIEPFFGGRLMSALTIQYLRSGDRLWQREAESIAAGLADLAVDRGRYAFFAPSTHYAVRGSQDEYGRKNISSGAHVAFVTLGLVHVYRAMGYEPAIQLAGKLINYLLEEICYIDGEGRFTPDQPGRPGVGHFHMHTYCALAILEYARVTGDARLRELACRSFAYGKTIGNTLLGYFPEWFGSERVERSELCEVADMIALGLKLSADGTGDYWDDVDRWTRNMFADGQLTPAKGEWLRQAAAKLPRSESDPVSETTERVIERNVGAFAGWPYPNDWGTAIQHCCTGNATRAIYYLWQHMLEHYDGKLKVNLLLNRPSPWADVHSHIPYEGKVEVQVKAELELELRIPEWVKPAETRTQVNGQDRQVGWSGRYAQLGAVQPGDTVTLSFPIAERTETLWIEKQRYTVTRKGNEVVAMDPMGATCPLYLRDHYRQTSTRWRKVERFVSDEQLVW